MKTINVVYTLIGIVILGLLIWFIYNQVQKSKVISSTDGNKNSPPTCVAECPDGAIVTYPCGSSPRCASTQRTIVFTPTSQVVNPELIRQS